MFISIAPLFIAPLLFLSCEGGLEPPIEEPNPTGVITGSITYSGEWPAKDSLVDLRFVPLKSPPQTAQDIFSDIENLVFSERLNFFVEKDYFIVNDVPNGVYVYNTVAQQFGNNIFGDWKPVGLYNENDGIIIVEGDTTSITIHVDFENLPPFPPD
ncbi:MAG: hypothetical protein GVY07_09735 [Bacteroidetes bacterium]|nr:hypothetical protein [Bacteroidota bacterium]